MRKRPLPALSRFVHSLVDSPGDPRVQEEGGVRCLRFGSGVVQSSMRVAEPFALELSYTRTMMGFLLFHAEPRHILLVGLGGGSLSKYCHRHLPHARITTLEINQAVIALRDRFLVPPDDERFRVLAVDACEYLATDDVRADVMLLDGYDAAGLPNCLCTETFYASCWRALSAGGVLVANLLGNEPTRATCLDRLREMFDGRVWWSRPCDSRNLIVFAVKNGHYYPRWSRLLGNARNLDARYRLGLVQVVEDMRRRPDPMG